MINGFEVNSAEVNGGGGDATITIIQQWIATRYICVLTGAPNGLLDDVTLPISSFSTRLNPSSASSFVQVVVPGIDAYADDIAARPDGQLVISRVYEYLDGSTAVYEMARADFDNIRTDTGGQSGTTGTLQGYLGVTNTSPKTVMLRNPTYRSFDGESVRYRCELNPLIRPGDTVLINDESLLLRTIQHNVDVTMCLMEISGVIV